MKNGFLILLALVCAGDIFAADVAAQFNAANQLYAEGRFAAAADGYASLLQTGKASPELLFNYGNAEFKSGHLGLAIAAYRQAALLAPRNSEIRANLAFVRNQVQGVTLHESRWQSWAGTLTLNEVALLTAILLWLTFTLLIARQIRPALAPRLKSGAWTFITLTILSATVLGIQADNCFSNPGAVAVVDNVAARSGPFADAQIMFTARDGAEFSVLSRRDDWVQVSDGMGKIGWLPAQQVKVLPGA